MTRLTSAVVLSLALCSADAAFADFVAGITPGTNTSATSAGNLTAFAFNDPTATGAVANQDYNGAPTNKGNINSVVLDLDVFSLGTPFEVQVATLRTANNPAPTPGTTTGAAEYFVTLNVKNRLGDNGFDLPDAGKEIGNFDIAIKAAGFADISASVSFDGDADDNPKWTPTHLATGAGSPLGFEAVQTGVIGGIKKIRFGGLSGGGGGIPYGATQALFFTVDIGATGNVFGGFILEFTANPEPTSLLLSGLVLGPLGIALARRRKKSLN